MPDGTAKWKDMRYDRQFEPSYGVAIPLAPGVARLTAPNPGPYTFHGTNTYLVGGKSLAIIDPGPDDDAHFDALMKAIGGRAVSHILLTHTHVDHSPLGPRLKQATGAETVAEGPHRWVRTLGEGEANPLRESADCNFRPDRTVGNLDAVVGDGWTLRAVLTPGHCVNHACYALDGPGVLFSGDHVMGWSSTIVAPPDGAMADYMNSLQKLQERTDRIYFPGHGNPIRDPQRFVADLKSHREKREGEILSLVRQGTHRIADLVRTIYGAVDPDLGDAAALSTLAHLELLIEKGLVVADGPASLVSEYRPD